jgi:hypothetical protein
MKVTSEINMVYDFLKDMLDNEILHGEKYSFRIDISDGGYNSYIGFDADVETWRRNPPVTQALRLYRHTNSTNKLANTWEFSLGNVCNVVDDHPDIALFFGSFGKTLDEAENEAAEYFKKMQRLIRKQTSDLKIERAKSAEEEKERLISRLHELGTDVDV